MPELPEVQTVIDDLCRSNLEGATIHTVRIFWSRIIAGRSPNVFRRLIHGKTIGSIWRRGKFIIFDLLPDMHLLVHLRMTGHLHLANTESPRKPHEHLLLDLADRRQLRFHDPRKFGRFYLVADTDELIGGLGPEPLAKSFTSRILAQRLTTRKRMLKPLLLDQTFIAGLGNIYVDEALWQSHLHPAQTASRLTTEQIRRLHRAIRKVLRSALNNGGTTLGRGQTTFYSVSKQAGRNRHQLNVFRRTHQPCPRCRTPIQRLVVGQRSSHVCPRCQPSP
jgi:formamidopyrimidine-DNA glycosylase